VRKTRVAVRLSPDKPRVSHPIEKWLTCHLLSSMESQGVRKFSVVDEEVDIEGALKNGHPKMAMKLWIFNPDIEISSSALDTAGPIRVSKVFWQDVPEVGDHEQQMLNRQTLSEGELTMPSDEKQALRDALQTSADLIPESGRKFQSWKVALLPRFTKADLG